MANCGTGKKPSAIGQLCATVLPVGKRRGTRASSEPASRGRPSRTTRGTKGGLVDPDFDDNLDDEVAENEGDEYNDESDIEVEDATKGRRASRLLDESARMKMLRARAIEQYEQVLSDSDQDISLDDRFKQRRNERRARMTGDADAKATRRKRAQTLKQDFFQKLDQGLDLKTLSKLADEESVEAHSLRGQLERSRSHRSTAGEEFNYPLLEVSLEERRKAFEETHLRMNEKEQAALDRDREEILSTSRDLFAYQDSRLRDARKESKRIVPKLLAQIRKVSSQLKAKTKENHQGEGIIGAERPSHRRRHFFSRSHSSSLRASTKPDLLQKLTPKGQKEQKEYHEQVTALRKELAELHEHLSKVRAEYRFPKMMQWKIRVDTGDGLFIGVRDVEVGNVEADFTIKTNKTDSSRILLKVSNLAASVGLLEFAIRGANAQAKILGGLLTPTVNRLDIDVKGDWTLDLRYMPGDNGKQARWVEVKEGCHFNLDIKRKVTGLTPVRLPKRILKTLSQLLIPKLISGALRTALPTQLGPVLMEDFTQVEVEGRVDILGDITPTIWREPLVGPTVAAAQARHFLGITEQEAILVDFMLRGPRAAAAGFKPKAVSLARLFKWRLKYSMYEIVHLEPMLDLVQKDSKVKLPDGWFAQLMRYVNLLSKKSLEFRLEVTSLRFDVDLPEAIETGNEIYLSSYQTAVNMARAQKAKVEALRQLEEAQNQVRAVNTVVQEYIVSMVQDKISLMLSGVLVGGLDTGLLAVSILDAQANLVLPGRFLLSTILPAQENDQSLQIEGRAGPRDDEYTIRFKTREADASADGDKLESADSELSLRNVNLQLFPNGAPAGSVRLGVSEVSGTVQLGVLDLALGDINEKVLSSQELAAAALLEQGQKLGEKETYRINETLELLRESETVLGLFRTGYADEEGGEGSSLRVGSGTGTASSRASPPAAATSVALPHILAEDRFDLRLDIKTIQVNVTKTQGRAGETLRAKLESAHESGLCAVLNVKFNMREVFNEIM